MSRTFFDRELDTVATFWRIWRCDGVAFAFTTHDRTMWFDGLAHLPTPALTPSAIRRTAGFLDDALDIEGALAHDTITVSDLEQGRFDGAAIAVGAVDWETLETQILYRGTIASVSREANGFAAHLRSAKAMFDIDPVPRSSPGCRARFCDKGCGLSPVGFTHRAQVSAVDFDSGRIVFNGIDPSLFGEGELVWLDGPQAGLRCAIIAADTTGLLPDRAPNAAAAPGDRAILREGCDHTIATCASRFGNAANFRGEPFLPGSDLVAHYPMAR
ncbi:MAG: DUF2163 domain-containing protein [Sphingomonadaceae bacterium]